MRYRLAFGAYIVMLAGSALCGPTFKREYIQTQTPKLEIPSYLGERYIATVPDTLDIAERARLAIGAMTGITDPEDHFSVYATVDFSNNPPLMKKEGYPSFQAKFMEALVLLRIATGSEQNLEVDKVWMNDLPKMLGPDGLIYRPFKTNEQFFSLEAGPNSRMMAAMMVYYLRDKNPLWKEAMEKLIRRLSALVVDKGDYVYISASAFTPLSKVDQKSLPPKNIGFNDGFNSRTVQQLGQFYKITGFEPAKTLGDKLFKFDRYHGNYFDPQTGEWLNEKLDSKVYPGREGDVGFGCHSHILLYLTDYVINTHNQEHRAWVKKSFDWAIERTRTIAGESDMAVNIGFFPEYLNPYYPTAENCGVADMIAVGLKLSQAGIGDYWDAVDGWIRNHFAENQITQTLWSESLKSYTNNKPAPDESGDQVVARNVGAFFSLPTPNDGAARGGIWHCCTGQGARTLYYIWEAILDCEDERLTVNLLLNRASKWADLDSYIPNQGRVDLNVKHPLKEIRIRAPQWIKTASADVACTVNGNKRTVAWDGRYIVVGGANPKDIVSLTFPIWETTVPRRVYGAPHETVIGGIEFERLVFRGATLVMIDPPGKVYTYYQRDNYRDSEVRYRKVQRFISHETINW